MSQVQKAKSEAKVKETETVEAKSEVDKSLNEDIDNILDEIDLVLEENAAEFVASFIQKGGE